MQLRRCIGEPLHRRRCDQHRTARLVSRRADAAAVRLRGQRDRHQRPDPPGLDRANLRKSRGIGVFRRGRIGSGRDVRRRCGGRRVGADSKAPGVPSPADRAADGPRRLRLRARVPPSRGDRRGVRPGPGAVHGETVDRQGCADPRGRARPLRGQEGQRHRTRRAGQRAGSAQQRTRGDGTAAGRPRGRTGRRTGLAGGIGPVR